MSIIFVFLKRKTLIFIFLYLILFYARKSNMSDVILIIDQLVCIVRLEESKGKYDSTINQMQLQLDEVKKGKEDALSR